MQSVSVALCIVLCLGLASPRILESGADKDKYRLPENFLLGAASSAYQVEGAWDADGKGVNTFDHVYHQRNLDVWETGDIAADFYHRYKIDIDIASKLGLNALRISLSWARIFPTGRKNNVNAKGVQFYHDLLDYMKSKSIEPIVTIYHFDFPQALADEFEGWLDNKMLDVFAEYSDFLFNEYGSKVKYWLTFNEGGIYCEYFGITDPTETNPRARSCLHNLLVGHALVHKLYEDKYKAHQKGLVGFGVGPTFAQPATDSKEDRAAADKINLGSQVGFGLSIDPLVFGDYPEEARTPTSPTFTEEEKQLVKGRIDFVGVNMYTGLNVSASDSASLSLDFRGGNGSAFHVGRSGIGGIGVGDVRNAWTLREVPKWVKSRYGGLPVIFTENGMATGLTLNDWDTRAVYCSAFLREMAAGINEEGTNVLGYTIWSLTDTFEFDSYEYGWGLVHVDFKGGALTRTPKTSTAFFKRLTRTWTVPLVEEGSEPFTETLEESTTAPPGPQTPSPSEASNSKMSTLTAVISVVTWTSLKLTRHLD